MIKYIVFVSLIISLSGCTALSGDAPTTRVRDGVSKFQDGKVTCYVHEGSSEKSISCLIVPEDSL